MSGVRRRIALGAMLGDWRHARPSSASPERPAAAVSAPSSPQRFWEFGSSAQFLRSWLFAPLFYARQEGVPASMSESALWGHFLEHGLAAGLSPSPFFDTRFVQRVLQAQGAPSNADPLELWDTGRPLSPTPFFDAGFYLIRYPDVRQSGLDPFVHWTLWGIFEGRQPAPFLEMSPFGDRFGSLRARRAAVHSVTSLDDLVDELSARSCIGLPILKSTYGDTASLPDVLSGRIPFMTDPQLLFGELGEWLPKHRNAILGLEHP
jgi:hypothetical protein